MKKASKAREGLLQIRVSNAEKEQIKKAADARRLPMATFVRSVLLSEIADEVNNAKNK